MTGNSDHPARSRRSLIKTLGTASLLGAAGCLGATGDEESPTETSDSSTLRAAFIYPSELTDVGWDRAHEDARQAVTQEHDWLETTYSDAVSGNEARQVLEEYINNGYDVLFGGSTEFMDPMYSLSEEYPDVIFEHCNGYRTNDNMGRYMAREYQGFFLAGVAAGHLTESNTLGHVASNPVPQLYRQINAFTNGARTVNPQATSEVRWLNTWYDPTASTQATNALTNVGADVILSHMSSDAAAVAAAENEAWAFGCDTSYSEAGGEYYGASQVFHWEDYYSPTLQSIRDGSWSSGFYWGGIEDGIVALDEFGPQVPDDVVSDVDTKRTEFLDGERTAWDGTKFEGESDEFLYGEMDSLIENVQEQSSE